MRPLAAAVSAAVTSLVVTMLLTGEAESSAPPGGVGSDRLEVYLVEVGPSDVELLAAAGVDTTHLPDLTEGGRVEIVATSRQARALRHEGLSVQVKRIHGVKASTVAAQRLAAGQAVYRTYGGPGGIAEELREVAAQHKGITKLVTIGTSRQGQPILALKVSNNARSANDGKRPAVLYLGAQHAREWITPEMVRRLMHHVIDVVRRRPGHHQAAQEHRALVRARRQPGRLRLHVQHRAVLAQEPARQQRRRPDHRRRRRRPEPQLPDQVGLGQRGLLAGPRRRDLPGSVPGLRAGDAGRHRAAGPGGVRVPRQLPLRRRAAALRHRLAGQHALARRPHLRGDGRRRRRPGRARLRPRHLGRALHGQRRDAHAGGRAQRDARLHARDEHVPDRQRLQPRRRVARRGLPDGLRLPRRRGPDPGRVRQERALRPRRRAVRRRPRRPRLGGRPDGARPRAGRVQRLLWHHPAGRRPGQASPGRQAAPLLRQRGTHADGQRLGVERRRALRRRVRPLHRRVPRHRHRDVRG